MSTKKSRVSSVDLCPCFLGPTFAKIACAHENQRYTCNGIQIEANLSIHDEERSEMLCYQLSGSVQQHSHGHDVAAMRKLEWHPSHRTNISHAITGPPHHRVTSCIHHHRHFRYGYTVNTLSLASIQKVTGYIHVITYQRTGKSIEQHTNGLLP